MEVIIQGSQQTEAWCVWTWMVKSIFWYYGIEYINCIYSIVVGFMWQNNTYKTRVVNMSCRLLTSLQFIQRLVGVLCHRVPHSILIIKNKNLKNYSWAATRIQVIRSHRCPSFAFNSWVVNPSCCSIFAWNMSSSVYQNHYFLKEQAPTREGHCCWANHPHFTPYLLHIAGMQNTGHKFSTKTYFPLSIYPSGQIIYNISPTWNFLK